ncbi:NAD(P)-binding protein [Phyllobacterium salinisoli]|uniref:NAD(P)-binding protein n=1 Tax=Phyllobacterium salinisoli TaxID=1899321 RepID=UPI00315C52FE
MTAPQGSTVAIVGAGPAGIRAAVALVAGGIRPIVIDDGQRAGGQIYRRPPSPAPGLHAHSGNALRAG